jgi:hypothetical protein
LRHHTVVAAEFNFKKSAVSWRIGRKKLFAIRGLRTSSRGFRVQFAKFATYDTLFEKRPKRLF